MFLEKRVYQGSSGRVYPLPFTDRIAEKPTPRAWEAIFIENDYLEVMILPALGGRIHRLRDKTNGYDAVYYQPVIKPALVGLAGPWASGGIEFNWPQHHRPSTFMPADVAIEQHPDGSATVWLGEHDPMARMKGMHGVRLHPGRSVLELVARAYNRTPDVQTFLWWANVATRVHESYQSFFPPDATHVADHAKRATDTYPLSTGHYYGVDYATRGRKGIPAHEIPRQFVPPHAKCASPPLASSLSPQASDRPGYRPDDLSWYANIPVPTSYMGMGSQQDFTGGYDHRAGAGLMHVANHHISPGKKQWTWGNHEFGYAWDRNLTDPDERGEYAPYIELMAGVYTDNQPDFSFLQPGETKSWSQFWYPFRAIGPAQHANVDAAVSLQLRQGTAQLGVAVTAAHPKATITVAAVYDRRLRRSQSAATGKPLARFTRHLSPDRPFTATIKLPAGTVAEDLTLRVSAAGRELISYLPQKPPALAAGALAQEAATEPPAPADVAGSDELYLIGLHLEQYRHATRAPDAYWREALRRDHGDSRAHLALGRWHLRRGEFDSAETHLRTSVARLTSRNPNPADGEAHYQLGLCLRQRAWTSGESLLSDAYAAFYKATWNQAWVAAGCHALAEIDATRGDWPAALEHLDRALRGNPDNLRARNLRVVALRQLGRAEEAAEFLQETLALDPLDWWAHFLVGSPSLDKLGTLSSSNGLAATSRARSAQAPTLPYDVQVRFDLALDCARAGLFTDALAVLADARPVSRVTGDALPDASLGTAPLLHYYRGWLHELAGNPAAARRERAIAARTSPDYCFPARLEEITILRQAMARNPHDARAPFYLGNLLYDRRRHREAIAHWEQAVRLEPRHATAWRNLGIGYFNILHRPAAARAAYARACRLAPRDGRLLYERDQLWKRLGVTPAARLRELQRHPRLVRARDDLSVEFCALQNQLGHPEVALPVVSRRRFQPWEGGEGQALGQHVRTHLALGRRALAQRDTSTAVKYFRTALTAPENLGEAKHLLANQSDIHYWLGCALAASSDTASAKQHWTAAAAAKGDFQTMSVRAYSEMTYYSALALQRLGRADAAKRLLRELLAHARALARQPAKIDYFATSLPTMLLFDDDLQVRQLTTALFLEAQARLGLGQAAAGRKLLRTVLQRDPAHALAADLLGSV